MSSFLPNTILKRTKNKKDAFDRVRVIADSPTKDATLDGWEGSSGECVLVEPMNGFASVGIAPVEALHAEYEVESYPEEPEVVPVVDPRHRKLVSPEEVFAAAAREQAKDNKKAEAAAAKEAAAAEKQAQGA